MSARVEWSPRLIESNVPVLTQPEKSQLQAPGVSHLGLVSLAFQPQGFLKLRLRVLPPDPGRDSVRDMHVLRTHVQVIEQMLLHVGVIASGMLRGDSDILIEVEGAHVAEAGVGLLTLGDDTTVHAEGSTAGRQAQHDLRSSTDCIEHQAGGAGGELLVILDQKPLHTGSISRPRRKTRRISNRGEITTRSASYPISIFPFRISIWRSRAGFSVARGMTC